MLSQFYSYWSVDTKTSQPLFSRSRSTPSTTCCLCPASRLSLWAFISEYSTSLQTQRHTYSINTHSGSRHLLQMPAHPSSETRALFSGRLYFKRRLKILDFWWTAWFFLWEQKLLFFFLYFNSYYLILRRIPACWKCTVSPLWRVMCLAFNKQRKSWPWLAPGANM